MTFLLLDLWAFLTALTYGAHLLGLVTVWTGPTYVLASIYFAFYIIAIHEDSFSESQGTQTTEGSGKGDSGRIRIARRRR